MYEAYAGILKMLDDFRDDGVRAELSYRPDADYGELKEKYGVEKIAGEGSGLQRMSRLLCWLSSHIVHRGDYDNHVENRAVPLLDYAFDKGDECGINCNSLSIALTECLLAVGIKARAVYLMPMSPYDFDNHVVCEAWAEELSKWVMLDPTYNLVLFDDNGVPLGVVEIREALADMKRPVFSKGANYNGKDLDEGEILTYYAKDFFRFMVREVQPDGGRVITVAPVGYDAKKSGLENIDYRIRTRGGSEGLRAWRKKAESNTVIYKGLGFLK